MPGLDGLRLPRRWTSGSCLLKVEGAVVALHNGRLSSWVQLSAVHLFSALSWRRAGSPALNHLSHISLYHPICLPPAITLLQQQNVLT